MYLEIPIGVNPRRLETWEPIIAKFKKKLTSWKQKYISFAERIFLINLVLSSLPFLIIFFLKEFWMGSENFEIFTKTFLWGGV